MDFVPLFLDLRGRTVLVLGEGPAAERKAALAIVMDQHAGRNGFWMDFLGRPASVHSSPARLHLITGYPLLFGCFVRLGALRSRMRRVTASTVGCRVGAVLDVAMAFSRCR